MKKLLVFVATGVLALQLVRPVLGLGQEDRMEKAGSRPGLLRDFGRGKGRAAIGTGVVSAKTSSIPGTLMVTKDGKTYTVNVDANTQLRRRFWGKATWEEISLGDTVNVIGQWADDAHTTVNAKLVRDASIQKRFGVFIGDVVSLLANGWTMSTHRGTETVTVSSSTKFVDRKGGTIGQADVKVGNKVRVRGLWDSKLSTITEVPMVKDFSLPTK